MHGAVSGGRNDIVWQLYLFHVSVSTRQPAITVGQGQCALSRMPTALTVRLCTLSGEWKEQSYSTVHLCSFRRSATTVTRNHFLLAPAQWRSPLRDRINCFASARPMGWTGRG